MTEETNIVHVQCAKEADWGELKATLKSIADTQKDIQSAQRRVFERLFGNGHNGLVTESALNKQGLKRVWWWLGSISAFMLGLLAWMVKI